MSTAPEFDAKEFRSTLGTFTTGVTIITTLTEDGEPVGLTANSFNSVSLDPPMVLWSLAKSSNSLDIFKKAEYWAVHILSEEQETLSNIFAKRGEDKFSEVDYQSGIGGMPLLPGCTSLLQCKTEYAYEGGDHIIFVGRVLDFNREEKAPLVFVEGRYAMASGKPSAEEIENATVTSFSANALDYLLPRAHYQIYSRLREHHTQLGLNDAQYFVLCSLTAQNNRTLEQINGMFSPTGHSISQKDLDDLKARNLVTISDLDDLLSLTKDGQELAMRVIAASKSIETDILGQFDDWEAVLLKKLLKRLVDITAIGLPEMWEGEAK